MWNEMIRTRFIDCTNIVIFRKEMKNKFTHDTCPKGWQRCTLLSKSLAYISTLMRFSYHDVPSPFLNYRYIIILSNVKPDLITNILFFVNFYIWCGLELLWLTIKDNFYCLAPIHKNYWNWSYLNSKINTSKC